MRGGGRIKRPTPACPARKGLRLPIAYLTSRLAQKVLTYSGHARAAIGINAARGCSSERLRPYYAGLWRAH